MDIGFDRVPEKFESIESSAVFFIDGLLEETVEVVGPGTSFGALVV